MKKTKIICYIAVIQTTVYPIQMQNLSVNENWNILFLKEVINTTLSWGNGQKTGLKKGARKNERRFYDVQRGSSTNLSLWVLSDSLR